MSIIQSCMPDGMGYHHLQLSAYVASDNCNVLYHFPCVGLAMGDYIYILLLSLHFAPQCQYWLLNQASYIDRRDP